MTEIRAFPPVSQAPNSDRRLLNSGGFVQRERPTVRDPEYDSGYRGSILLLHLPAHIQNHNCLMDPGSIMVVGMLSPLWSGNVPP